MGGVWIKIGDVDDLPPQSETVDFGRYTHLDFVAFCSKILDLKKSKQFG